MLVARDGLFNGRPKLTVVHFSPLSALGILKRLGSASLSKVTHS